MSEYDNFVEYADPVLYDQENQKFEPDGPFYLALARRFPGPTLELGCGTGRLTIPLSQGGIDMTGLDVVPGMLELARKKSAGLTVQWAEADARTFQLDRRFRLIFESGAMFQHLLERPDQEAVLARVREHLTPDGCFVLGAMIPNAGMMENEENESEWFSYSNGEGQEVRVSGVQHYDPLRQVKTETAYRRWHDADGQEIVRVAPLKLRLFFPQELEALLHYNGFMITERYGDLDFSPLTESSAHQLYLCQKK